MPAGEGAQSTSSRAAAIVELSGDVDIASADQVHDVLDRAIASGRTGEVVVDLSQVSFMDCRGLDVLVSAHSVIGDRLILQAPSRQVRRLLDLTELRETFVVTDGDA